MTTEPLAKAIGDSSLERPKFRSGLLLQAEDLTQSVDYTHDLIRLLFRSILGCGVLCGFKVIANIVCNDNLQIKVAKGIALDCHGDLIELPDEKTIRYAPPCGQDLSDVWVVICHKERDCSPRDVLCSTQDGEMAPSYTRTREGYEIRVLKAESGIQPTGCCGRSTALATKSASSSSIQTKEDAKTCCDYIASPKDQGYESYYAGECACDCANDCIVLAKIIAPKKPYKDGELPVDHSVRRYIRPVLMKDPLPPSDKKIEAVKKGK